MDIFNSGDFCNVRETIKKTYASRLFTTQMVREITNLIHVDKL